MEDTQIGSNEEAASLAVTLVKKELGEYCSLRLDSITSTAPVSGSIDHDGLGASVQSSMEAWQTLLEKDAADIESISSSFSALDLQFSHNLLGLGGELS